MGGGRESGGGARKRTFWFVALALFAGYLAVVLYECSHVEVHLP